MGYIMELRKFVGTRPLIMVGACVLIFNEQGHLLLQRRTDSLDWGTIGGALEPGESLEEAAARELFEEAGLKAKAFKFITVFSGADMYYKYPHGDEVYNVLAVYEAIDVEGTPTINDDEGLELRYFTLKEPIAEINSFTESILRKLGYIQTKTELKDFERLN
ncbi:NUDIX hydrolase [Cohnella faecalis]|uniref:NUDIX domain-containing protein n=1 Tax=Cohnella faecalis TaxID=2315694 RepID=A0A398CWH4_9BACL|nr:NUDIX hydrolase [Cohnella faecalis]RIE03374.1 NUDIX domain-containing protein [Cohnella faecalis]